VVGVPTAVDDEARGGFANAQIQILQVEKNSPAELSGIKAGDIVKNLDIQGEFFEIEKISQLQDLIKQGAGKEIVFNLSRAGEDISVSATPRESSPNGEGPLGVALMRVATIKYPIYEAVWRGAYQTFNLTVAYLQGLGGILKNIFVGGNMGGLQLMGPVGISHLNFQMLQLGINYFLNFIVVVSIALAVCNLLPIPSLDGGKLMFLIIESIKGSPVNPKIENTITSVMFILLLGAMVFITYKDILGFF